MSIDVDGYSQTVGPLLVIGYDGSADARHAIDVAGRVVEAPQALVAHVGQDPLVPGGTATAPPVPIVPPVLPSPEEDAHLEEKARRTAEEGVARARAAGMAAESEFRRGGDNTAIARWLMDLADARDADLIVVGRRGMSRVKTMVLGSVSDTLVRDGRHPVLVVPGGGAHGEREND